jgi:C4-dicarboxylate transporter DctM subunit
MIPAATERDPDAPQSTSGFAGLLIAGTPLLLAGLCLAAKFGLVVMPGGVRVGLIFALLVALMVTGMPISIALGLTVLTFLFTLTEVPLDSVALKLFTGIEKFEIMAIPFFILAGNFLTHGGVAKRLINLANALVGHWYGGLGLAGVIACALFAAVSGSSPATVVAIGSIILPAMVKQGFPQRFGAGVITTSGALGILIPPSIVMVMYSVATSGMMVSGPNGEPVSSASVGQLFMAGVIPGLMLATMLAFTTWYRAWKNDYPRGIPEGGRTGTQASLSALWGLVVSAAVTILPITLGWIVGLVTDPGALLALITGDIAGYVGRTLRFVGAYFPLFALASVAWLVVAGFLFPKRLQLGFLKFEALKVWNAYWSSIWGLLLVIIVIGGIYTGAFTPTEAAAMSAVYAFVIAVFVYKDMGLTDVPRVLLQSANMSAMLLYIITNAVLFSFLMTSENIPQAMAGWISETGLGWIGFLFLVNILLLLAGNVMEPSSIVLIMAPILFPVAVKLGIDPVHFGILIVVNMEVGMCHPPVGLNLYVASGIAKMGITELTVAVWPWLLTMLVFLVLVTYWPGLSLWLPRLLGM